MLRTAPHHVFSSLNLWQSWAYPWAILGPSLGYPVAIPGPSWSYPWAFLGSSCDHPVAILLVPSWCHPASVLGPSLGHFAAILSNPPWGYPGIFAGNMHSRGVRFFCGAFFAFAPRKALCPVPLATGRRVMPWDMSPPAEDAYSTWLHPREHDREHRILILRAGAWSRSWRILRSSSFMKIVINLLVTFTPLVVRASRSHACCNDYLLTHVEYR